MILGIDVTPFYPYIALFVLAAILVMSFQAFRSITNATKVLSALVDQVGTNGKSTLRAELTALAANTESVRVFMEQKAVLDKNTNAAQVESMKAQDAAIAQLQGLVKILGETMGTMGLDRQIRNLIEAQKAVAQTTLNVMNAQTEKSGGVDVSGGTVDVGQDIVGGNATVGGNQTSK